MPTPGEEVRDEVRAAIEQMPEKDREHVYAIAGVLRAWINKDPHVLMALTLIGAEEAAKE